MSLIALEEHYAWDPASADNVVATWLRSKNEVAYQRLYDRGPLRLEQMDAAGIDFQILSLFDPGVQAETDTARAIDVARRANDDLAETVRGNPNRFGGFATLATQDPDAAAAEFCGIAAGGAVGGGRQRGPPRHRAHCMLVIALIGAFHAHQTRGAGPAAQQMSSQRPVNGRGGGRRVERVHRPSSRYPGRIVREGIARRVT
jgi:hypothetical protein